MSQQGIRDEWTARIVADPTERHNEFRRASITEMIFGLLAAGFAIVAVCGFLAGAPVLGVIEPATVGGIAAVCFTACMAIAAGGGIKKHLISLVTALEAR